MESTLKIDYSSRHDGGIPVVKIIQPIYLKTYDPAADIDPRDAMVRDFLHTPCMFERNAVFGLSSYFDTPNEKPTHSITHIEPVAEERILSFFQHQLIRRFVSEDTLNGLATDTKETLEKINSLFNYLSELRKVN